MGKMGFLAISHMLPPSFPREWEQEKKNCLPTGEEKWRWLINADIYLFIEMKRLFTQIIRYLQAILKFAPGEGLSLLFSLTPCLATFSSSSEPNFSPLFSFQHSHPSQIVLNLPVFGTIQGTIPNNSGPNKIISNLWMIICKEGSEDGVE